MKWVIKIEIFLCSFAQQELLITVNSAAQQQEFVDLICNYINTNAFTKTIYLWMCSQKQTFQSKVNATVLAMKEKLDIVAHTTYYWGLLFVQVETILH